MASSRECPKGMNGLGLFENLVKNIAIQFLKASPGRSVSSVSHKCPVELTLILCAFCVVYVYAWLETWR